ncbi:MAG: glycoside hydrolase family 3 C-terminal domain-containing protein, partial [Saprospiraceae bacterium]|nr:glycoside hydrolase family 3 C-terminal domain-containing protein [Saprospiraceae bacterium]
DQTLYNIVLPPFKAAVDAGVASVMNAFQDLNGIPATAHRKLQRDLLKGEWGFTGVVLSDWASINELITHGYAADRTAAAVAAITAGSDMDMEARIYEEQLPELVRSGAVDEALINDAARRVLKLKFQLGLFDDPYRYSDAQREQDNLLTEEHLRAARETGAASIVLLKNDENLLPLERNGKKIAVIGQLAESKDVVLGSWRAHANANSGVSILEGIRNAAGPGSTVRYAQGYTLVEGERAFVYELNIVEGDRSKFPEAVRLAANTDVVIMAIGEDCYQTGEGRSQADIGLKGHQTELIREVLKVNPNVVAVLMNGRPLAIPEVAESVPAIIEAWYLGSEMGNAVADVLFGDVNPSGKLPVSFPQHSGQEPFYYHRKSSGRPVQNEFDKGMVFWAHYTDASKEAVFPFGFGLSYASFEYDGPEISANAGQVTVSVTLTNTSQIAGTETVQVYIRDVAASETQPARRLVDFQKVALEPRESKIVRFDLTGEQLGYFLSNGEFITEDGEFEIFVGGNVRDTQSQRVEVSF